MPHTPGPWTVDVDSRGGAVVPPLIDVIDLAGQSVCEFSNGDEPRDMANAHLIAAAPDLLDALTTKDVDQIIEGITEFIVEGYADVEVVWQPYIDKLRHLRAAIVKAGGR